MDVKTSEAERRSRARFQRAALRRTTPLDRLSASEMDASMRSMALPCRTRAARSALRAAAGAVKREGSASPPRGLGPGFRGAGAQRAAPPRNERISRQESRQPCRRRANLRQRLSSRSLTDGFVSVQAACRREEAERSLSSFPDVVLKARGWPRNRINGLKTDGCFRMNLRKSREMTVGADCGGYLLATLAIDDKFRNDYNVCVRFARGPVEISLVVRVFSLGTARPPTAGMTRCPFRTANLAMSRFRRLKIPIARNVRCFR
jgi:hypothetical protein